MVDYVKRPGPMRSAARNALPSLKADEFDDLRGLNPERYAITVPPSRRLRPMVEWEEMSALMMALPGYLTGYSNAWNTMADIARHGVSFGQVWVIVSSEALGDTLRATIRDRGGDMDLVDVRLRTITAPLESVWFVDFGPQPVIDPATNTYAFADYRYYHDRPLDDGIPTWLGRKLPDLLGLSTPTTTYRMPLTMEGGTFQATEDGLCFTGDRQVYHMSCAAGACDPTLLTRPLSALNAHPLVDGLREMWSAYLGCRGVVVTRSISDDATGHLDMYLKVLPDRRVLLGEYVTPFAPDTAAEENASRLDENAAYLSELISPDGQPLRVLRMEMPGHRSSSEGGSVSRVPFTYLNATFFNGLNLWPAYTFDDWSESRARAEATWEEALPSHTHIWVDSEELSFWSGAIHCVTRTIPAGKPGLWIPDGACGACGCVAGDGGYEGPCQPGSAEEAVCYGPAWECSCPRCDLPCALDPILGPTPDPCRGVDALGCCDEDSGALLRCVDGRVETFTCEAGCGGDPASRGARCGGLGAGPSCATRRAAFEGCEPRCDGVVCGEDGCGGHCGTCAQCELCLDGQCTSSCEDACEPDHVGCDGARAYRCAIGQSGCLEMLERDCAALGQVCGEVDCEDPPLLAVSDAKRVLGCNTSAAFPSLWLCCWVLLWRVRRSGRSMRGQMLRYSVTR